MFLGTVKMLSTGFLGKIVAKVDIPITRVN